MSEEAFSTDQIKAYYENYDEQGRLFRDKAHLPEYLTTIRYFDQMFLPNSSILDACAGTGRYAFYLANKGHSVTANDLVEHHVNLIKAHPDAEKLAGISVGNILDMSNYEPNSFDVVLCMGALYHLSTDNEKIKAISNCVSLCKPGGLVVLAYVNYFAAVAAEVQSGLGNLTDVLSAFEDDSDFLFKVTTPTKMEGYAKYAKLEILKNIGVDGISFVIADKINAATDEAFDRWMEYIYQHCEEPSTVGYSMHGLLIGRKIR